MRKGGRVTGKVLVIWGIKRNSPKCQLRKQLMTAAKPPSSTADIRIEA
jgi:hypothetical protein